MAAKKSVTFYAAADVAEWISGLDSGEISRHINDAIREGALKPKSNALFQIPLGFYQMGDLLKILKEVEEHRAAEGEQAWEADPENTEAHDEIRAQVKQVSDLIAHFEQFVK